MSAGEPDRSAFAQLTQRVAASEHEIISLRAELLQLQRRARRARRGSVLASACVLLAAAGALGYLSSASMQAQSAAQPLTVKAPFTVVDAANQPILTVRVAQNLRGLALFAANHQSVIEAGTAQEGEPTVVVRGKDSQHGAFLRMKFDEPELELRSSDSQSFVHLQRSGAALRAPFTVTDVDDHPIAVVQDGAPAASAAPAKPGALPRGIHVFNTKGAVVARAAADKDGHGFMIVRGAAGKSAVAMLAGGDGGQVTVAGVDGKVTADLASKTGLNIYGDSAAAVVEISGHTGSGRLWLGNGAGVGIVEAGLLPDGRGVVRTGPRNGGPLGMGTLNLPWAITGHK